MTILTTRELTALLFFGACLICHPAAAYGTDRHADYATGYVYHDQNGDGARQNDEPGVSGVIVSNGSDVTTTDRGGRYRLSVDGETTLFIVKPSGWRPPLDDHNLPRFYYHHRPEGSPELEYAGIAPTGSLPPSIDFALYPQTEPERFRALIFGDPQPYTEEEVDYFASDVIDELTGIGDVAFGLTLGDNVGDDLDLLELLNDATAQVGVPWYNVLGNHDMNYDATSDPHSDETFERIYGPTTFAFVYSGVHFIVVDDVIYPPQDDDRSYIGGLRPDQLAFVENYVAQVPNDDLVVITMHIPIDEVGNHFRSKDRKQLFQLLKDHPNTLSLSAHTHTQRHQFFDQETGWTQTHPHHHYTVGTTSGSWWNGMKDETGVPHTMMRDGTPNGYVFITFDGNDYVIDYKVAGQPASYQMNVHAPTRVERGTEAERPELAVNVFNGNEKTDVAFRVGDDEAWQPMEKVAAFDPFYVSLDDRWNGFEAIGMASAWERQLELGPLPGTALPDPQPSSHLWKAPLPTDLPEGRHRIEVRAKDMFGRTFTGTRSFRVVE